MLANQAEHLGEEFAFSTKQGGLLLEPALGEVFVDGQERRTKGCDQKANTALLTQFDETRRYLVVNIAYAEANANGSSCLNGADKSFTCLWPV